MPQCRRWNDNEYEYIERRWGKENIPQIAKALNRSENAVKLKIVRQGLGRAVTNAECLNARQASDLLGIDIHTVTDYWTKKCGLKYTKIAPHGTRLQMFIKVTDLFKWLEKNQDKWDSRKLEQFSFGFEPEWLKQKRISDSKKPKNKAKIYTPREDTLLKMYFYDRSCSYAEIGEIMERSASSVQHRLFRLNKKKKTEKMNIYWQKETCEYWKNECLKKKSNCDECPEYKRKGL